MHDFFQSPAFTWALNALFFGLCAWAFVHARRCLIDGRAASFVDYAPSLMTSLGLFGTFLGIFVGLLQFDPAQIDGSITLLLGGLKTAFVTSIIGMFFAIAFKVLHTRHQDARPADGDSSPTDAVGPADIHAVLQRQHEVLGTIARGIGGQDERSLVGQLQMLRTDVADFRSSTGQRHDAFEARLLAQLDNFAAMLSRSATEQVITALQQVIVEFNQKLTEQFGDNFKRLDASVQRLVEWQDGYREQLGEMSRLYRLGTESIDATRVAVSAIGTETARIPQDMRQLHEVLAVNQHQIAELSRHLDAFVTLRDRAVGAVPQIQQQLDEVGQRLVVGAERVQMVLIEGSQQFEASVRQTQGSLVRTAQDVAGQSEHIASEMKDALEMLTANTERIRSGITSAIAQSMTAVETRAQEMVARSAELAQGLLGSVQQTLQTTVAASERARTESQRTLDSANQAMVQHAERSLQAVERQVEEAVGRTHAAVNEQLRQLDEALGKQLNAALQELGSSLASIAGHLMDTYRRGGERERARPLS
ncbi:MotA/TolQ/ExbB proton channel family protein [Pseudaquabacterium rugosum]|uniref:MotA/TolQ/ExbB proton channel family protein n=1 Tax=Pseudaquabacterium rugosum TaxID=2984194 RepID=A0ABU9BB76_9BURK